MHDRIVSPRETLVYWVEYVLRHKGSKHFRSAAKDLKWYQLHMLDVLAVVISAVYLMFCAIRALCRRVFCRKSKKTIEKTKKKPKRE